MGNRSRYVSHGARLAVLAYITGIKKPRLCGVRLGVKLGVRLLNLRDRQVRSVSLFFRRGICYQLGAKQKLGNW